VRLVAGCCLALLALGGILYMEGMHAAHPVTTLIKAPPTFGAARRLVVFVKGGSADLRTYQPLLRRLLAEPELANSDVLLFDHQLGRLTIGHDYDFATRLRTEVDAQWIRHGSYDDVILAGHSTGSLLLRAAYLQSAGRDPRQPRTVPWSDRVSRIVLLAGIGRGVDAEEHGRWSLVLRVGRFIPLIRSSVMYDVLRGADFVTEVRIAWIRYFSELNVIAARDSSAIKPPTVVQVIGTEDGVLRRDDNIDLEQFPTAYHIDVPGAGHQTLHRLDLVPDPELAYSLFRQAFVSRALPDAARQQVAAADSIHRVVLLLHGMRSSRDDWVHEIAPLLRKRMPDAEVVESSYGWISLLSFALPSARRREIRWLQDQYTEYLARHPRASFDVIAHSNGAYLVGQALEHVPSLRFDRVALLGSVLPADYQWDQRREWGQARLVRTDRASDDFVVAVFCNALRGVGMTDVGTSGWSGFEDSGGVEHEISWYRGGHSAALSSSNLNDLADFLATGRVSDVGPTHTGPSHSLALLSQLAPWLARLIFLLALGFIARWLWRAPQRQYRVAVLATAATILMIVLDVV
jgi:alpha-beta hydrolase superfamily lysophospholipase